MSSLTRMLAPLAIASALAGSVDAADYVKETRWGLFGAGHTITVTHTEPGVVYTPQRVISRDACGRCYEGIGFVPQQTEVITSQCKTNYVDWDKSIIAAPGNLLTAIGRALTPCGPGPGVTRCYTAPQPIVCGPCR